MHTHTHTHTHRGSLGGDCCSGFGQHHINCVNEVCTASLFMTLIGTFLGFGGMKRSPVDHYNAKWYYQSIGFIKQVGWSIGMWVTGWGLLYYWISRTSPVSDACLRVSLQYIITRHPASARYWISLGYIYIYIYIYIYRKSHIKKRSKK